MPAAAPLWHPLRNTFRNRVRCCRDTSTTSPFSQLLLSRRLNHTSFTVPPLSQQAARRHFSNKPHPQETRFGTTTPVPDDVSDNPSAPATSLHSQSSSKSQSPFYFEAGYALYAKRPSRPFPPPFLSYPSHSFTEPLSTWDKSRDRRPGGRSYVNGEMIRGVTNGDDAVLVSDQFVGVNDGVGAWAAKERGHAA